MLEIAFRPDRTSEVPVSRQLAEHLAAMIADGRLSQGARLPPTRDVALALGLGRNTVGAAYEQLAARDLVAGHVGRGTFVIARTRGPVPRTGPAAAPPAPREFGWPALFARAGHAARVPAAFRHTEIGRRFRFDFRGGRVDADALPVHDLRWAFARPFATRTTMRAIALHQDPYGYGPLRREIAHHLAARGITCDPGDVAVVNGLQHAIQLVARLLVDPGDAVAMEQPGYFGAALAFAGRGATVLGIDVDGEGLRTDRLARLLAARRVKLVYTTPAAQSPTGASLSDARRTALLALADEHQVPVLEDDYDSVLRWSAPPRPPLKALDRAGQVIYAGTFSKLLFPGLRVGWVVAARPLLDRLVTLRALDDFGTGVVEQAALATLLATRGLERHVQRVRRLSAARRDAMLAALDRHMPPGTRWTSPQGGHLVWLTLPGGVDPDRLEPAAAAAGVAYTRGEVFHADGRGGEHLALAFTSIDRPAIEEGIGRLAAVVREQAATPGSRPPAPRARRARATPRRIHATSRAR